MPPTRSRKEASDPAIILDSGNSRKRKRGDPALAEASINGQPSPRSRAQRTTTKIPNDYSESASAPSKRSEKINITAKELLAGKIIVGDGKATAKEELQVDITAKSTPKGKTIKRAKSESDKEDLGEEDEPIQPKRKRKTKEEKEAEQMPLAARTVGLKMFVGAHTSVAKGVENAITNCAHIGGNAFACFLKSQRKWENPPLKEENRNAFKKALVEYKYDALQHVVPHGSYLVNLATSDRDKAKQSYDAFLDDLRRCEALGIRHYNFHPGGAGTSPLGEAVARLASQLNRALSETKTVVPLLENMAGHGTLIGGRFSDLRDVIALIKPEYKSRIGVCIDTCHAFAAGYDLRTPEAFQKTMDEFEEVVGIQYLKALHLNDSKAPFNSHRDLHQNIGLGFLGLRAFHNVMNEPRFENLPLVLETPCERPDPKDPKGVKTIDDKTVWATEIKLLESLIGMDPEGAEFNALERELGAKGKKERDEMQAQFDKKVEKERKKLAKEREKGQASLKDLFAKGGGKATTAKTKKQVQKEADSDEESELSDLSE